VGGIPFTRGPLAYLLRNPSPLGFRARIIAGLSGFFTLSQLNETAN
jgi:hypothetical protein